MSILTKALEFFCGSDAARRKNASPQVRIWSLSEDDDDLPKLQREIAARSLTRSTPQI